MPRDYKRRTEPNDPAIIKEAVNCAIEKGLSIRQVSRDLQVPRATLQRYVTAAKDSVPVGTEMSYNKGSMKNRVF